MYRQRAFWLRDHNSSKDYNSEAWSSYTEHNRSIWCEAQKDFCSIEVVMSHSGVMALPVGFLRQQCRLDWYPNDRPLKVMKFLKIKKVL